MKKIEVPDLLHNEFHKAFKIYHDGMKLFESSKGYKPDGKYEAKLTEEMYNEMIEDVCAAIRHMATFTHRMKKDYAVKEVKGYKPHFIVSQKEYDEWQKEIEAMKEQKLKESSNEEVEEEINVKDYHAKT